MNDQTPAGLTRDEARAVREWAELALTVWAPDKPVAKAARVVLAALPTPPRPTLADMTPEERAACQWMQADVDEEITAGIIAKINPTDAHLIASDGETWFLAHDTVTPRPDLPRLEWPGDQGADAADTVPEGTLAVGSEWEDVDALTRACEETGRDQITVIDKDGDVSVWDADTRWWGTGSPDYGFEPYTILHAGKKADQ